VKKIEDVKEVVIFVEKGRSEVEVVLLLMKMEMVVEKLSELLPERSLERWPKWWLELAWRW